MLLKNDFSQVPRLLRYFDGALDEECFTYRECRLAYRECRLELPFVRGHKPVFVVEYAMSTAHFCRAARRMGFVAQRQHLNLGLWHQFC